MLILKGKARVTTIKAPTIYKVGGKALVRGIIAKVTPINTLTLYKTLVRRKSINTG